MENQIKLVVNNIIGSDVNGMSRVTIAKELFNAMRQIDGPLEFKRLNNSKNGEYIREYNIENVKIYSVYNPTTFKNIYLMDTEEAKKRNLDLSGEINNREDAPFNVEDFDTTIRKGDEITKSLKEPVVA